MDHPVHCQACSLAGSFPQFPSPSLAACAPSRPALRPSRGTHVLSLPFLSWLSLRLLRVLWQRKEENDILSSPLTIEARKKNLEIGHYILPEAKRCWGGRETENFDCVTIKFTYFPFPQFYPVPTNAVRDDSSVLPKKPYDSPHPSIRVDVHSL